MGACAAKGCGGDIFRGDHFTVLLGDVLVHRECLVAGLDIDMGVIAPEAPDGPILPPQEEGDGPGLHAP